jgi:glycosyltransferase involved in cell wall biosynthesis
MNPFFSIIIPAYNREKLISATIQSVIKQTFSDWECIVVDDGSTDGTKDVIQGLIEKDSRIRYVYQKNAERSAARNNGINNSQGEYICFLDSDDFYTIDHLQLLEGAIKKSKFKKALFFTSFNNLINNNLSEGEVEELIEQNKLEYFLHNAIIPARVCGHKSIFEKEKFDEDIVIVEDLCLWTRIAFNHQVYQLEQKTVIYAIHEDNSINLKSNAGFRKLKGLKVFFKRYPEILKKAPKTTKRELLSDCHFRIVQSCIYQKRKFMAIKHTLFSIFYNVEKNQLKHKIFVLFSLVINKKVVEYSREL